MKIYQALLIAVLFVLQGCSALSKADTRTTQQQWFDQQIEMKSAAWPTNRRIASMPGSMRSLLTARYCSSASRSTSPPNRSWKSRCARWTLLKRSITRSRSARCPSWVKSVRQLADNQGQIANHRQQETQRCLDQGRHRRPGCLPARLREP